MQGSEPIKVDQQVVQKKIEDQIGGLMIQLCIKDAIIETLQAEINSLKLGVLQPNGSFRPDSGQTDLGRHGAQGPDDKGGGLKKLN